MTRVKQEIVPTDRLLEAPPRAALPYYFPHAPQKDVKGRILSVLNGVEEIGPNAIVTVSLGKREGMEEGHVLRIMRHAGTRKDPVTRRQFKMPDEESGLLMAFRGVRQGELRPHHGRHSAASKATASEEARRTRRSTLSL